MDQIKQQLRDDIFKIDMEYIDPVVWYVYNPETGSIDDFRDAIHYKVHIDRFLELGAVETDVKKIDATYIEMLRAKSGIITFFEIPQSSAIEVVEASDDLASFFNISHGLNAFIAVKIAFE